jgi:hypothetical protein
MESPLEDQRRRRSEVIQVVRHGWRWCCVRLRLAVAARETEEEQLRRHTRQRRSCGGVRDCGRHGETDEVARLRVRGGRRWCGAAVKE